MPKANNWAAAVFIAAIALLGTVNGRIYRTDDAVVFEFDRAWDGSLLAKHLPLSQSDYLPIRSYLSGGLIPQSLIPLMDPSAQSYRLHSGISDPRLHGWPYPPMMSGWLRVIPVSNPSSSGKEQNHEVKQSSDSTTQCGAGPGMQRIINGMDAIPNSWPFYVGVTTPSGRSIMCGGSLIADTKVLIAASCVEKYTMVDMWYTNVKLGMHKLDDSYATRRITRMVIHKDYNPRSNSSDIAILTLDAPVRYSNAISPVCLPAANTNVDAYAGKVAYIMGWGTTNTTNTNTTTTATAVAPMGPLFRTLAMANVTANNQTLKQAAVMVITSEECKSLYQIPGQISNTMMCASSAKADFCEVDVGGPLVMQTSNGLWTQIGIASWSAGCKSPTTPASVYTNVAWLRWWINANMLLN